MEPIVIGGLIILIFAAWDSYQNWKITHPKKTKAPQLAAAKLSKTTSW